MNTCGSCSLCCKVLAVEALGKKAGEWCVHWVKGKGCGIYETRPQECRDFNCLWLEQNQPEELKPASTHVVFLFNVDETSGNQHLIANVDPARPTAAEKGAVWRFIQGWLRAPGHEKEAVGITVAGDVMEDGKYKIRWARRAPR